MLFTVLALLSSLAPARADLPVHCLRHQVRGTWEFELTKPGPKRSSCGHHMPDGQFAQPPVDFVRLTPGGTTKRRITLEDPNTASSDDGSAGTWTMIYDEGFEVAFPDLTFFAFSHYHFKDTDNKQNVSDCGETQVGWYRNKERSQWGCYAGKKVEGGSQGSQPSGSFAVMQRHHHFSWETPQAAEPSARDKVAADLSSLNQAGHNFDLQLSQINFDDYKAWVPHSGGSFDRPLSAEWHQSVADRLNLLQLGWTAHAYKHLNNMSARSMNKKAGIRRHIPKSRTKDAKGQAFLGTGSRHRRLGEEPDALDWRIKNGESILDDIVAQGDCGSCYTIASIRMLSARNRVRTGNPKEPPFSISFPLYCSEYNQGCDGGYGFLQSKWSEDVGLVPETCAPYTQSGECKLPASCSLGAKRHRAVNHHYVGGYYGGSEEEPIKQELLSGPLVMSFEPKEDFMYYKDGVYKSMPEQIHQEWEQVDHAVLLVGYGVDKGQKYWLLQNSWGEDWGEDGFFRMARGSDESGCESIVVSADVAEEDSNPILDDFTSKVTSMEV